MPYDSHSKLHAYGISSSFRRINKRHAKTNENYDLDPFCTDLGAFNLYEAEKDILNPKINKSLIYCNRI